MDAKQGSSQVDFALRCKIISNKDLWKVRSQENINLEIRKRKFSWSVQTLRKEDGEIPKAALL
jgi:hypothetical protein